MKIPNYEDNFFTYTGDIAPAVSFFEKIKNLLIEEEVSESIPKSMGLLNNFIKDVQSGNFVFEKYKEVRLMSVMGTYFFEKGANKAFNVCDECGELFIQIREDFENCKELKGTGASIRYDFHLGKDNGNFYCSNCRVYSPLENGKKMYIPVSSRIVLQGIEVFKWDGSKAGTCSATFNKASKIKAKEYFCFADDVSDGRATIVRKKTDYVFKRDLNKREEIPGRPGIFKRHFGSSAIESSSYFFRSTQEKNRCFKVAKENPEGGFYYDVFCKAGENGFILVSRIPYIEIDTVDASDWKRRYKVLSTGYKYCELCGRFTLPESDYIVHVSTATDSIDITAFNGLRNLCKRCIQNRRVDPYKIYNYRTKVDGVLDRKKFFLSKKFSIKRPIYYGIELEANTKGVREETVRKVLKKLDGYAFAKRDGSLDDVTGVEFVSVPASFDKQREIWSRLFDKKYSRTESEDLSCSDLYAYSDPRCGLHIHIDRASLNKKDICFLVYFINKYRNFCAKIAGRKFWEGSYSKVKELSQESDPLSISDSCFYNLDGRYEAVNLQNSGTIEVRIFKANVTMSAFFRYLEFTDALVHFCKSVKNLNFKEVNPAGFMKFTNGNNKYKFLNDFYKKYEDFFKNEKIKAIKQNKEMF